MKVLILYNTITGNTRNLAEIIKELVERQYGYSVCIASTKDIINLTDYDLVFLGTYTWNEGEISPPMKKYLRKVFIDERIPSYPHFAVFGTGDTQFGGAKWFCRAVDAMEYYCNKYANKTIAKLKIEQNPMSEKQLFEIWNFVSGTLKGIETISEY